jgi:hypothetical protein
MACFLFNFRCSTNHRRQRLTSDVDLCSNTAMGKDVTVPEFTECEFAIIRVSPKIFHGVQSLAKAASRMSKEEEEGKHHLPQSLAQICLLAFGITSTACVKPSCTSNQYKESLEEGCLGKHTKMNASGKTELDISCARSPASFSCDIVLLGKTQYQEVERARHREG